MMLLRRSLPLLALLVLTSVVSGQIVINEFNAGTPDFIELRNLGLSSVTIGGWSVATWYSTGGSFTSQPAYSLPGGTTIPAGGTLVLQENGTPGQPGSLGPCSISVGTNYAWTGTRSIIVALSGAGSGVDYVMKDLHGFGGAPNLPVGTTWTGGFTSSGESNARFGDVDTNGGSDWTTTLPASGCALNPGQSLPAPVDLTITTTGAGDSTVDISTSPVVPSAQFYTLVSLLDFTPNGSGPIFGVGADVIPQFAWPAFAGNPFHSNLDGAGAFSVSFPAGSVPIGTFIEAVTVVLDGTTILASNVVEVTY